MPKAMVLGCGRSGTNMATEILRRSPEFRCYKYWEDRDLFISPRILEDRYLAKGDTHYIPNNKSIQMVMRFNRDLKIVWMIRNPKDMVLSKIFRGQPGQDNEELADDATEDGCVADIQKMFQLYKYIDAYLNDRVFLVKMEDLILNFDATVDIMCQFVGINRTEDMNFFYNKMWNKHKDRRYNSLDVRQVDLYKRTDTIYGGFFKNSGYDLEKIYGRLKDVIEYFGYD